MRIVHLPSNTANQAGYMVRALRALGHEAEVWEYGESPFGFPCDRVIDVSSEDSRVLWDAFLEAIERFDVFHFHFARSFFRYGWQAVPLFWDLPILRMLGKKVFFTFLGADCTIRRIHEHENPWSYFKFSDLDADDDLIEKKIQVIRTFANRMFVLSLEYLPFIPDAELIPRTIDLREWPEQPVSDRSRPLVLHMPSRRGKKGSDMVIDGMRRLEAEGLNFEFRLLEGVSHAEARKAIQEADVVVDNILTGDYEIVSIETMASSRVAISYVQDRIKEAFPGVPVYDANPDTFVDRMRTLLTDHALRRSLAARGRPFVAAHHDAPLIAERLVHFYEEESQPVPIKAFPNWIAFGRSRKVERLEERIAKLEADRARLTLQVNTLRRRAEKRSGVLPPSTGSSST